MSKRDCNHNNVKTILRTSQVEIHIYIEATKPCLVIGDPSINNVLFVH